MLVSGLVLALYFWAFFTSVDSVSSTLLVSSTAAIVAGVGFVSAAISYLWAPQQAAGGMSLGLFSILAAMTMLLLYDTGLAVSPFIAFWALLALFAPIMGMYGVGIVVSGIAAFLTYQYLEGAFAIDDAVIATLTGVLPLGIGYLVWPARARNGSQDPGDSRSYHELATEFSTVSGQSEIVIAAIADGVISINNKSEIQLINPAAQKMIGWDKKDALGLNYKSVLKLVDNRDQPPSEANDPIQKALSTNTEYTTDTLSIVTANSGKKFLALLTASPVGSMGSGLIIVFRDITKERAEEREQAEFISTASHEMRTPVASIEGYLGLALNPTTASIDDKAREFITKAHESAQHLGRLFQDLLDVSKADDGRLSNNPRIVEVAAFVNDIVQGQMARAAAKHLQLRYKPDPSGASASSHAAAGRVLNPVFYTKVDNDHLREVIGNLIENAIKYTPEGAIEVDVTGDDTSVTISIKDSGIGIPQEDIGHLFQKFYRVDNSDTREIGGTGLGLYLCRRLVEAIGGQIWVESTYQEGSTFFVKLPRIDAVAAHQEIEAAGEDANAPQTPTASVAELPVEPLPSTPIVPAPQPPAAPAAAPTAPSGAAAPPPTPPVTPKPPLPVRPSVPAAPVFDPRTHKDNTPISSIENNPDQYLSKRP